jgi:hypothetical protein
MHEISHKNGNPISVRKWKEPARIQPGQGVQVGKKNWPRRGSEIATGFLREGAGDIRVPDLTEIRRGVRAG